LRLIVNSSLQQAGSLLYLLSIGALLNRCEYRSQNLSDSSQSPHV